MTEEELELVAQVKAIYESRTKVDCTACNYCMPCPSGVDIPRIFSLYNTASMFNEYAEQSKHYERLIEENKDASNCVECSQCEGACPQNIAIIDMLKEAHEALTK